MDTVQLDFGRGRVNLTCRDVTLRAGAGAHALVFRVEVRASWLSEKGQTPPEPLLVCAEVSLDSRYTWIGATQPAVWQLHGFNNVSEDLTITLTDDQLLAVERQRGDGDLALRLKVHGSLLLPTPTPQVPREVDMPVRVSRETWLQQLNNAGVEVGILLRIRSPLTDDSLTPASDEPASRARMSRVIAHLAQAKQSLLEHAWEGCVLHCRKALEVLKELAPVTESEPSIRNIKAQQRTESQRWALVFHDTVSLVHPVAHADDDAAAFRWKRANAEAALAFTGALVTHYLQRD
jgi:hypothetical protein